MIHRSSFFSSSSLSALGVSTLVILMSCADVQRGGVTASSSQSACSGEGGLSPISPAPQSMEPQEKVSLMGFSRGESVPSGTKLVAVVNELCLHQSSNSWIGEQLQAQLQERKTLSELRAYSFQLNDEVSLRDLKALAGIDSCLIEMSEDLQITRHASVNDPQFSNQKHLATLKFFIYTMVGSLLMLVALIGLMYMAHDQLGALSSNLLDLYKLQIPFVAGHFANPQTLMFFAFCLAFAIKVPLFPLHTWLPDAHVEAPTPGSVILAGVMLKMGTYGFLRFVFPLFPEATQYWSWLFLVLGVIGIVYGALVAMIQPDIKKLVAYSSVSHMGYVVVGLFAMNSYGITGGLYQMLNHGISTGALFLLVGMIYERTHSREISQYGGLAVVMPIYAICFFIVTLSSIAVPGTNGFVGEFLILMGAYLTKPIYAYVGVLGVIFGAAYMLWMFKRVFFGEAGALVKDDGHHGHGLHDLNPRELVVLAPLLVLIVWMGVLPQNFLKYSKASIEHLVQHKSDYQLSVHEPKRPESTAAVKGESY